MANTCAAFSDGGSESWFRLLCSQGRVPTQK